MTATEFKAKCLAVLDDVRSAEVAALPDDFQPDPADRVLVASVRVLGATLATADRRIVSAEVVATLS